MRLVIKEQISLRRPFGVTDDVDLDNRQIIVVAEALELSHCLRIGKLSAGIGLADSYSSTVR